MKGHSRPAYSIIDHVVSIHGRPYARARGTFRDPHMCYINGFVSTPQLWSHSLIISTRRCRVFHHVFMALAPAAAADRTSCIALTARQALPSRLVRASVSRSAPSCPNIICPSYRHIVWFWYPPTTILCTAARYGVKSYTARPLQQTGLVSNMCSWIGSTYITVFLKELYKKRGRQYA